jgi:hypothetical protein
MSNAIIAAIGGVVFIAATWATIAFLLTRFMALEERNERELETG